MSEADEDFELETIMFISWKNLYLYKMINYKVKQNEDKM